MTVPIQQIARAVETVGGDLSDIKDLVAVYKQVQAKLTEANRLDQAGDRTAADAIGNDLEQQYAKPLEQIARDRIRLRRERGDR